MRLPGGLVLLLFVDHDRDLPGLDALGGFFVLRTTVPSRSAVPTLARAYAEPGAPDEKGECDDLITFRIHQVAAALRTPEPRVAVSVAQQGLAARLWSIALGAAVLHDAVPDLDPRLLHWDPAASAPDDLWLPEVRLLPVTALDDVVRAGHLVPLNTALHTRYGVSRRLLWGNAGSALAATVRELERWAGARGRPDTAARVRALATALFTHPDLAETLDPVTRRRRSCCLYYRVPGGGLCGDCCFDRAPGAGRR